MYYPSHIIGLIAVMISALHLSSAATLNPWSQEQMMKYTPTDLEGETPHAFNSPVQHYDLQKRYSQSMYSSERGRRSDRAAVRKLFSLLMGKRSVLPAQKRSSEDAAAADLSSPTFDNVHGFVLLAGRVTDNILQQALGGQAITDDEIPDEK